MESFAFFKPVLASNLGAIKEFVLDGLNGVLFDPGNAINLASKASYLFSHKKELLEMGKNANKIYRERFGKERNYNDLMNIYSQTISTYKK
jgi:glycosyltransferase involved in cell wall biosynthesis